MTEPHRTTIASLPGSRFSLFGGRTPADNPNAQFSVHRTGGKLYFLNHTARVLDKVTNSSVGLVRTDDEGHGAATSEFTISYEMVQPGEAVLITVPTKPSSTMPWWTPWRTTALWPTKRCGMRRCSRGWRICWWRRCTGSCGKTVRQLHRVDVESHQLFGSPRHLQRSIRLETDVECHFPPRGPNLPTPFSRSAISASV